MWRAKAPDRLQIQLLAAERAKHDLASLVFSTAGGVTGTIEEVGLFVTTLLTPDNVRNLRRQQQAFFGQYSEFFSQPVDCGGD